MKPVFCQLLVSKSGNSVDSIYIAKTHHTCIKSLIIPAALIFTGSFMTLNNLFTDRYYILEERNEEYIPFHHSSDDYLQYSPLVLAGIAELVDQNTNIITKKHVINLIKTQLIVGTLSYSIKSLTRVKRPDSETLNSFPSGHTVEAFALATFFYNEYGNKHSKWVSFGGFAIATTTGVMRILNGRHWISDVVAGAGVGILSANLGCMDWRINKESKTTAMIVPSFSNDFAGASLIVGF